MAKGIKPEMPIEGAAGKQQSNVSYDEDLENRRQKLAAELKLKDALKKTEIDDKEHEPPQGMAQAVKLSSEFLSGVVIGVVLGLGFDKLVGTSPWGLIVFLFLGFAAGALNVLRSVGRVEPSQIGQKNVTRKDNKVQGPE